jgi:hypothetical protein
LNKEQLTENPKKKYIEAQYSAVTQGYLQEYCADNGFDLSTRFDGSEINPDDFDFHTTVWFTTTEHIMPNVESDVNIDDITPMGFALFGPEETILVLEIESEKLTEIRETIGAEYGMQDMWPEYRPHITLSYSYHEGVLPEVEFPNADLLDADKLKVKDQKVRK